MLDTTWECHKMREFALRLFFTGVGPAVVERSDLQIT